MGASAYMQGPAIYEGILFLVNISPLCASIRLDGGAHGRSVLIEDGLLQILFQKSSCWIHLVEYRETWVPLGPTDQAYSRPRQVGPAYQKTHRPVSGPNRSSWRPTRPPEDLLEDSPDDLIQHDLKTRRTKQDLVDYDQSRSTGYGRMCNVDLGLLVVTDQESGTDLIRWPI
jgi:hypothetical protein